MTTADNSNFQVAWYKVLLGTIVGLFIAPSLSYAAQVVNKWPITPQDVNVYPGQFIEIDTSAEKDDALFRFFHSDLLIQPTSAAFPPNATQPGFFGRFDFGTEGSKTFGLSQGGAFGINGSTVDIDGDGTVDPKAEFDSGGITRFYLLSSSSVCLDTSAGAPSTACELILKQPGTFKLEDGTDISTFDHLKNSSSMHVRWRIMFDGPRMWTPVSGDNIRSKYDIYDGSSTINSNTSYNTPVANLKYIPTPLPTPLDLKAQGENDTINTSIIDADANPGGTAVNVTLNTIPAPARIKRTYIGSGTNDSSATDWNIHRVDIPGELLPNDTSGGDFSMYVYKVSSTEVMVGCSAACSGAISSVNLLKSDYNNAVTVNGIDLNSPDFNKLINFTVDTYAVKINFANDGSTIIDLGDQHFVHGSSGVGGYPVGVYRWAKTTLGTNFKEGNYSPEAEIPKISNYSAATTSTGAEEEFGINMTYDTDTLTSAKLKFYIEESAGNWKRISNKQICNNSNNYYFFSTDQSTSCPTGTGTALDGGDNTTPIYDISLLGPGTYDVSVHLGDTGFYDDDPKQNEANNIFWGFPHVPYVNARYLNLHSSTLSGAEVIFHFDEGTNDYIVEPNPPTLDGSGTDQQLEIQNCPSTGACDLDFYLEPNRGTKITSVQHTGGGATLTPAHKTAKGRYYYTVNLNNGSGDIDLDINFAALAQPVTGVAGDVSTISVLGSDNTVNITNPDTTNVHRIYMDIDTAVTGQKIMRIDIPKSAKAYGTTQAEVTNFFNALTTTEISAGQLNTLSIVGYKNGTDNTLRLICNATATQNPSCDAGSTTNSIKATIYYTNDTNQTLNFSGNDNISPSIPSSHSIDRIKLKNNNNHSFTVIVAKSDRWSDSSFFDSSATTNRSVYQSYGGLFSESVVTELTPTAHKLPKIGDFKADETLYGDNTEIGFTLQYDNVNLNIPYISIDYLDTDAATPTWNTLDRSLICGPASFAAASGATIDLSIRSSSDIACNNNHTEFANVSSKSISFIPGHSYQFNVRVGNGGSYASNYNSSSSLFWGINTIWTAPYRTKITVKDIDTTATNPNVKIIYNNDSIAETIYPALISGSPLSLTSSAVGDTKLFRTRFNNPAPTKWVFDIMPNNDTIYEIYGVNKISGTCTLGTIPANIISQTPIELTFNGNPNTDCALVFEVRKQRRNVTINVTGPTDNSFVTSQPANNSTDGTSGGEIHAAMAPGDSAVYSVIHGNNSSSITVNPLNDEKVASASTTCSGNNISSLAGVSTDTTVILSSAITADCEIYIVFEPIPHNVTVKVVGPLTSGISVATATPAYDFTYWSNQDPNGDTTTDWPGSSSATAEALTGSLAGTSYTFTVPAKAWTFDVSLQDPASYVFGDITFDDNCGTANSALPNITAGTITGDNCIVTIPYDIIQNTITVHGSNTADPVANAGYGDITVGNNFNLHLDDAAGETDTFTAANNSTPDLIVESLSGYRLASLPTTSCGDENLTIDPAFEDGAQTSYTVTLPTITDVCDVYIVFEPIQVGVSFDVVPDPINGYPGTNSGTARANYTSMGNSHTLEDVSLLQLAVDYYTKPTITLTPADGYQLTSITTDTGSCQINNTDPTPFDIPTAGNEATYVTNYLTFDLNLIETTGPCVFIANFEPIPPKLVSAKMSQKPQGRPSTAEPGRVAPLKDLAPDNITSGTDSTGIPYSKNTAEVSFEFDTAMRTPADVAAGVGAWASSDYFAPDLQLLAMNTPPAGGSDYGVAAYVDYLRPLQPDTTSYESGWYKATNSKYIGVYSFGNLTASNVGDNCITPDSDGSNGYPAFIGHTEYDQYYYCEFKVIDVLSLPGGSIDDQTDYESVRFPIKVDITRPFFNPDINTTLISNASETRFELPLTEIVDVGTFSSTAISYAAVGDNDPIGDNSVTKELSSDGTKLIFTVNGEDPGTGGKYVLCINPQATNKWLDKAGNQFATGATAATEVGKYDPDGNLTNSLHPSCKEFAYTDTSAPELTIINIYKKVGNSWTTPKYITYGDEIELHIRSNERLNVESNTTVNLNILSTTTLGASNSVIQSPDNPSVYIAHFPAINDHTSKVLSQVSFTPNNFADFAGSPGPNISSSFIGTPIIKFDNKSPTIDNWIDTGSNIIVDATDNSSSEGGLINITADLGGGCSPALRNIDYKPDPMNMTISQILGVQRPLEGFTCAASSNLDYPATGTYVRVWLKVTDEAGNVMNTTGNAGTPWSKSSRYVNGYVAVDIPVDLSKIVSVSYSFDPKSPLIHGLPADCPGAPSPEHCEVDINISGVAIGDGALATNTDIYLHVLDQSENVQSLYDPLTLLDTDPLSTFWEQLSGSTFDKTSSTLWPNVNYAKFAIGFIVTRDDGVQIGTVGTKVLELDRRQPGQAWFDQINDQVISTQSTAYTYDDDGAGNTLYPRILEPIGNISPTFQGVLDYTIDGSTNIPNQNPVADIHIDLYRGIYATRGDAESSNIDPVGALGPIRSSEDGVFEGTYVIRLDSRQLTGCTEAQLDAGDYASCTYTAFADATTITGLNKQNDAGLTFHLMQVEGFGSYNATNDVSPITADGNQNYEIKFAIRDGFGNRIPDASIGCFKWIDSDGKWVVEADSDTCQALSVKNLSVLLPDQSSDSTDRANIDLIATDDDFDETALLVGNKINGPFRPYLEPVDNKPGEFAGNIYPLAPSNDSRPYIPNPDTGIYEVNSYYGSSVPMDVDAKLAFTVSCPDCDILGNANAQYSSDHAYLNIRKPSGMNVDPITNIFDPTNPILGKANNALVYSPFLARGDSRFDLSSGDYDLQFVNTVTTQIPTVHVKPMVEAYIRQITSVGDDLTDFGSIVETGGFERLGKDANSLIGWTVITDPIDVIQENVHGGKNAVQMSTGSSISTEVSMDDNSRYRVSIWTLSTDPAELPGVTISIKGKDNVGTDLSLLPASLSSTTLSDQWQNLTGTIDLRGSNIDTSKQTTLIITTNADASHNVVIDTLSVIPESTGETARRTPLILGTGTRWQIDLVNNGASTVAVDPMDTVASLTFRYGTAIWGNFDNITLSKCHPYGDLDHDYITETCGTAYQINSDLIEYGTQDMTLSIDSQKELPLNYKEIESGHFIRVSFTATAGIAVARVASTEGLANTEVRYEIANSDSLSTFKSLFSPNQMVTYASNALALNIYNPISSIAEQQDMRIMPFFTNEELKQIKDDISRAVALATREVDLNIDDDPNPTTDCMPGNIINHDSRCIAAILSSGNYKSYVVATNDLNDNAVFDRDESGNGVTGLTAYPVNESTLETLPDSSGGGLNADIYDINDPYILPTYGDDSVIYVPGNLTLTPELETDDHICLPAGLVTIAVRGNVMLFSNLIKTQNSDPSADCYDADVNNRTEAFGIISLTIPSLGDTGTNSRDLPGGSIFLATGATEFQAHLYAESAVLEIEPGQDAHKLATISTLQNALDSSNTGTFSTGLQVVTTAESESRTNSLRNQLLVIGRFIGLNNTWNGAENDMPEDDYNDNMRVAVDMKLFRLFQLDQDGIPLLGGKEAPSIYLYPEHAGNSVVILPDNSTDKNPPLLDRVGAFGSQLVGG